MINQIKNALKAVFFSYSPRVSFIESALKIDFKMGDRRTNIMQMCFSPLASWLLMVILLALYFNHLKSYFLLTSILNFNNPVLFALLDGRTPMMLAFFIAFTAIGWIIKYEYLLVGITFFLVSRQEVHINLALAMLMGIYLGQLLRDYRLVSWCESNIKVLWSSATKLRLLAWLITSVLALNALDYISINFLFSAEFDRFRFLAVIVLLYNAFAQVLLSLWGHFYFMSEDKKKEPTDYNINFSTVHWLKLISIRKFFLVKLLSEVGVQKTVNNQSIEQYNELLILRNEKGLGLSVNSIKKILDKQRSYLEEAQILLTQR